MQKNLFIILLLFLFSCNNMVNNKKSQHTLNSDSIFITADSIFKLGKVYSEDSNNQQMALKLYRESFILYEQLENRQKMASTYKWMGYAYDYLEEHAKVKEYHKKALKINIEIDNKKECGIIQKYLGTAYAITGDIDSALMYYYRDVELCKITKDTAEIIEVYQNIGLTYVYAGDYQKAVENGLISLKYCEKTNYIKGIFELSNCIASYYIDMDNIEMALHYCKKAEQYIDSIHDPYSQASFYHIYANALTVNGNDKKARLYYLKNLAISKKADYKRGMAAAYYGLADIELTSENYKKAEEYANLSIEFECKVNHISGVALSLVQVAHINYLQKKYDEAMAHLKKAEKLAAENDQIDVLPEVYYSYYRAYKLWGKLKPALQYCEKYYTLNDSLTGIEVKEKIADLEIKYQTEKKQHEIKLLKEENNTKKQKIKTRNLFIISLVLLVITIISISFFFRIRAMQKLSQMETDIQKYILKINDLNSNNNTEPEINSKEFLKKHDITERETEVLYFISEGMTNADIAEKIFVSTNTIKYHIKNIYLKLDVKNRVEVLNKIATN